MMASATRCRDVVGAWQWVWLVYCTGCTGRCGEGSGSGCGDSVAAGVLGGVALGVLVMVRGVAVGVATALQQVCWEVWHWGY